MKSPNCSVLGCWNAPEREAGYPGASYPEWLLDGTSGPVVRSYLCQLHRQHLVSSEPSQRKRLAHCKLRALYRVRLTLDSGELEEWAHMLMLAQQENYEAGQELERYARRQIAGRPG